MCAQQICFCLVFAVEIFIHTRCSYDSQIRFPGIHIFAGGVKI